MQTKELNIQPEAGILGVFSRLNYKLWYAIAEFVDNSTQSFFTNEEKLHKNKIDSMTVKIDYDSHNHILTIEDDAFGMSYKDFIRAVKLDSKPENQNGRNEFGMGLKTAASWFGNIWSVESTEFASAEKYFTEIDIGKLRATKKNTVSIKISDCDKKEHGTKIVIKDITKRIDAARTKNKILNVLSSMYRRDLATQKINIIYDGEPLSFAPYEFLSFRNKTWRKELDFNFSFDDIEYSVKGFVGILKEGGFGKAGFSLFRRNRIIRGGEDMNYKPKDIFGQEQSTVSHKLFGELDLDDFPVNQAKDDFIWDDGLESKFISEVKKRIDDYISVARMTIKERTSEENLSKEKSDEVKEATQKSISNLIIQDEKTESSLLFQATEKTLENDFEKYLEQTNNLETKILCDKRSYKIPLDAVSSIKFNIKWSIGTKEYWIEVSESDDSNECDILININHPFFKPYSKEHDFQIVLEKFVVAFVLAEKMAKKDADSDGKIIPSVIRNKLNDYLSKMKE